LLRHSGRLRTVTCAASTRPPMIKHFQIITNRYLQTRVDKND
jgi:hypothetical protein